jgi:hypothetical protein
MMPEEYRAAVVSTAAVTAAECLAWLPIYRRPPRRCSTECRVSTLRSRNEDAMAVGIAMHAAIAHRFLTGPLPG